MHLESSGRLLNKQYHLVAKAIMSRYGSILENIWYNEIHSLIIFINGPSLYHLYVRNQLFINEKDSDRTYMADRRRLMYLVVRSTVGEYVVSFPTIFMSALSSSWFDRLQFFHWISTDHYHKRCDNAVVNFQTTTTSGSQRPAFRSSPKYQTHTKHIPTQS